MRLHPVWNQPKPGGCRTHSEHLVDLEVTRQAEQEPLTLSSSHWSPIHYKFHEVPGKARMGTHVLALFNSSLLIYEICENKRKNTVRNKVKIKRCPKMFIGGYRNCITIFRKHQLVLPVYKHLFWSVQALQSFVQGY